MAVCTLLTQQVTRVSGGFNNHCKVMMSINNNSRCVGGPCVTISFGDQVTDATNTAVL